MKYLVALTLALALAAACPTCSAFTTHQIPSPEGRSYTQVLSSGDADQASDSASDNSKPQGGGGGGGGGGGQLVAINQNSIEFSAGSIGGAAGLVLGGPILAAILGGTTNYLARKDVDAASEAVKGVAEKGIGVYNYVGKLLVDNDVTGKLRTAIGKSNPETLDTLESTWNTVSDKADELAVADILARALGVTGDALEKIVDAALVYADENGVADKVKAASGEALTKAKAAADQAAASK